MAGFYEFLTTLAENNNRPWFEANKKWYESARKEAEQIFDRCIDAIRPVEDFGDLAAKKAMFRIYRDVRFSKNKDPYKKNFSAMLAKGGKKEMTSIGFYVHFQPGENFMAAGIYEPSAEQLAKIRQEIDYNPQPLKDIIFEPEFVKMFGKMEGNQLKTTPKGYPKDHPEIELLRFNQFYFSCPFTDQEVLAADFPAKLAEACKMIRPFLEYMNQALD
jgi:uncharacterized protein (TIGR02453 family)